MSDRADAYRAAVVGDRGPAGIEAALPGPLLPGPVRPAATRGAPYEVLVVHPTG